ncbi:hypothetical protein PV11_06295 [Exophiala sideris]|uniref:Uncharacterized protein n=1 Tax=Exophiala sideris TaxID=1016849 RepID=A0A0D1Y726_9EURO|nr:hypothetical protein PV11_06295 [Exophiala sideris]
MTSQAGGPSGGAGEATRPASQLLQTRPAAAMHHGFGKDKQCKATHVNQEMLRI